MKKHGSQQEKVYKRLKSTSHSRHVDAGVVQCRCNLHLEASTTQYAWQTCVKPHNADLSHFYPLLPCVGDHLQWRTQWLYFTDKANSHRRTPCHYDADCSLSCTHDEDGLRESKKFSARVTIAQEKARRVRETARKALLRAGYSLSSHDP